MFKGNTPTRKMKLTIDDILILDPFEEDVDAQRNSHVFSVGDMVTHHVQVEIVNIHPDAEEPYYDVRMPDGAIKQTVGNRLNAEGAVIGDMVNHYISVEIVKIYYDAQEPYYDIRMPNGAIKQTVGSRLHADRDAIEGMVWRP